MLHSTWLFLAFGLALVVVAFKPERIVSPEQFQLATRLFAGVLFAEAFFQLLRAANYDDAKATLLIGIWTELVTLVLMGLSLLMCFAAIAPRRTSANSPKPPDPSPHL